MTNYEVELAARNNFQTLRERERRAQLTEEGRRISLAGSLVCAFEEEIESSVFYKRLPALDNEPITVALLFAGMKKDEREKKKELVRNIHPHANTLTKRAHFPRINTTNWYF